MTTTLVRRIEALLWPAGLRRDIWMIVDSARDRRIFPMLLECHLEHSCLYSGPLHPALEIAAPYLVQLDYDYRDTHRFIRESWGRSWGVFLKSDTGLSSLRRHLREFLIVRSPDGRRLVFRYYDPRVLRVYLPTCTARELTAFFGPIERFWMEGETADRMVEFRVDSGNLVSTGLPLEP